MKNMLRVAAVTPKVHIGSVSGNVREIMDIYEEYKDAADIIVTQSCLSRDIPVRICLRTESS